MTKHDYAKQQSIRKEFYFSLILGFLVLVKPFFVYLPFLIYGLFTLKNFSIKNIINKRIVLLIFPVLMYLGWSYVNKVNTGFFVSTTYLGMNLSQNCVYFAEKAPKEYQWIAKPYAEYREKTLSENRNVAMSLWNAYGEGHVFDQYNLTFSQLTNEFQKYAKLPIVPLVITPDKQGIQDSTPIMDKMEELFPEPKANPDDEVLNFISILIAG